MSDASTPMKPGRGCGAIGRLRARAAGRDRTRIPEEPERSIAQRRAAFAAARLAVLDALSALYRTTDDEDPTAMVLRAVARLVPPELRDRLLDLAEAAEDRFAEEERRRLEGPSGEGSDGWRRRQG